jgi:uncharacterized delta-60 repeat protein
MAGIVPKRGLREHDIQLARFLPQGNVDSSFNSPVFEFGAEPATGSVRALAVQPDGRILVGGEAGHFGAGGFGVARFNANGSFDTSFGNSGITTTPFPNATTVEHTLLLQPDGRIAKDDPRPPTSTVTRLSAVVSALRRPQYWARLGAPNGSGMYHARWIGSSPIPPRLPSDTAPVGRIG